MIVFLEGRVLASGDGFIIIKTDGGVGYEIFCKQTLAFYVKIGDKISLHTYLAIKEDAHIIYGFDSIEDLYWFKSLIKVSGVGLKTALAVLNCMSPSDIINAIQSGQDGLFAGVSGIGKKTATRIASELEKEPFKNSLAMSSLRCSEDFAVITLQDDIDQLNVIKKIEKNQSTSAKPKKSNKKDDKNNLALSDDTSSSVVSNTNTRALINDASLALEALGYQRLESFTKASLIVKNNPNITIDELIKACLQKE